MLRQIEWRLQNGPITKSGVLPVTALFFKTQDNIKAERSVQKDILSEDLENFHEYLRKMTNKFTQNICHTKDNTYHDFCHLRNNKDIVLLSGDKDSPVVVTNKVDYVEKVNSMINEGM